MNEQLTQQELDSIEPFQPQGQEIIEAQPISPAPLPSLGAFARSDQARTLTEVQASMMIARANPRKEQESIIRIKRACLRHGFAEKAFFAYRRGGHLIQDVTIRFAEVLAQAWGNMTYGFREINRFGSTSEVEAFAWDLETNTKPTRQFQVRHYRDTKDGSVALEADRDVSEHIASQAQRRVRACILQMIPADIIDMAKEECLKTLKRDQKPIEDRVKHMVRVFSEIDITEEMLERFLQHKLKGIAEAELIRLMSVYNSIVTGIATVEEFFGVNVKSHIELETELMSQGPSPDKAKEILQDLEKERKPKWYRYKNTEPSREWDGFYRGTTRKWYDGLESDERRKDFRAKTKRMGYEFPPKHWDDSTQQAPESHGEPRSFQAPEDIPSEIEEAPPFDVDELEGEIRARVQNQCVPQFDKYCEYIRIMKQDRANMLASLDASDHVCKTLAVWWDQIGAMMQERLDKWYVDQDDVSLDK